MLVYDKSFYYVDFSKRDNLTDDEKTALERILETYRPIDRADFLIEYRVQGKISDDDYETCTGIPYRF